MANSLCRGQQHFIHTTLIKMSALNIFSLFKIRGTNDRQQHKYLEMLYDILILFTMTFSHCSKLAEQFKMVRGYSLNLTTTATFIMNVLIINYIIIAVIICISIGSSILIL